MDQLATYHARMVARKKSSTAPSPSVPRSSDESATRVLRRFRVVFNAVKMHFREVEKKAGIAGAQVWALSVVHEQPGIGVGELARNMDIHQSTASNLVKPLIEAGLMAAERSGADRRAVQLKATARGQRILRKAPGPFTGVLPDALQSLDQPTLARLERDLGKLARVLGADAAVESAAAGRR